ncbi:hypothetical protein [Pseudomonas sp. CCOS 191]|uniref:hypothetical protein n=1 Tax=Pseudomonas sp. CCOS 191 TaxID=1649877 RepID=UPI0006247A2A|nr:hypothetical protein [Pseudomonas sp. CCOS 191]CRI58044.1 hypothetical protein CCOS191_3508 [Pseudomonas sp. CCOS 191]
MKHIEAIERSLRESVPSNLIARKIFLSYPTAAFKDGEDLEFEILNKIKDFFDIPFSAIQIVGSSKTEKSLHKENTFTPKVSDLDVAIIDPSLFLKYVDISYKATNGYSDLTKFRRDSNQRPTYHSFFKYTTKGIFRPDLMPQCKEAREWRKFFSKISADYRNTFKSINAGLYASEYIFESKHSQLIEDYRTSKGI